MTVYHSGEQDAAPETDHDDELDALAATLTAEVGEGQTTVAHTDDARDPSPAPPLIDPPMVRTAYRVLIGKGSNAGPVTEVRVLGGSERADGRYAANYFGYFDNSIDIVRALQGLVGWSGVYLIPNAVDSSLLARSMNKLKKAEKDLSTTDRQILRRRWLLLDIDWSRPAGISTTDEEHDAAIALLGVIADTMRTQHGWPKPVRADSGNGAHALWAVDLPADSDLPGRVLAAFGRMFGTDDLKIDQTVKNASRIWKLYGTLACKGDSTRERPHRLSKLLGVPRPTELLTEEMILVFINKGAAFLSAEGLERAELVRSQSVSDAGSAGTFDAKKLMESAGIEFADGKRADGYTLYPMKKCPCDRQTAGCALTVGDNGGVGLKCLHDSCDFGGGQKPGDAWRKWREANDDSYGGTKRDVGGWALPVPFDPGKANLPMFPCECLPTWLREMVLAVSVATQTPIDLPAMVGLGVVALSVARKVEIAVKKGYTEPLNLYTLSVLSPAERKSAVLSRMVMPVERHEVALMTASQADVARAASQRKVAEAARDKAQQDAARATDAGERTKLTLHAADLAAVAAKLEVPVVPRLITEDATPEALTRVLVEQGGRVAVVSSEGGVFDIMGGRYSQSGNANLDVYLKGHAGEQLRVDRIGRATQIVLGATLTVVLTVQPEVLRSIASKPGFRGRGLLGRFLYSLPTSRLGSRSIMPPPVPDAVEERYEEAVLSLLKLASVDVPHALYLAPAAEVAWVEYATEIEPKLGYGGDLGSIQDWAGKHCGAVARIAGVLHLAEHAQDAEPWVTPVCRQTMEQAITIGRYLVQHAVAAFGEMGADPAVEAATLILSWLRKTSPSEVTKRDIHRALHRRFPRADDLDRPLAALADRGYLRARLQESGRGRPASPVYDVNPLGLSTWRPGHELFASAAGDNGDDGDTSSSAVDIAQSSVTDVANVTAPDAGAGDAVVEDVPTTVAVDEQHGDAAFEVAPAVLAPTPNQAGPSHVQPLQTEQSPAGEEDAPWPPPSWKDGVPPWEVVRSAAWQERRDEMERIVEDLFNNA